MPLRQTTLCFATLFLTSLATETAHAQDALRKEASEKFGTIASVSDDSLAGDDVELGRSLFWDERLSKNGKIACASCHLVADWGADRRQFSLDAKEKLTSRNSQTIFNATMQPALRWASDRKSGADQAEKSLTGSMGFASADDVVPLLKERDYEAAFRKAYPKEPEPITPANYAKAIEAYEKTLVTPAPFDRFLEGDDSAIDEKQKEGLKLFLSTGCADCHKGRLLGGESNEKFGVVKEYWTATKSEKHDAGRFEVTKEEKDRYTFRISMLRNIAKTAPYFHDGSVDLLTDAIQVMADVQLGQKLSDEEAKAIGRFLESLTGEIPSNYSNPK